MVGIPPKHIKKMRVNNNNSVKFAFPLPGAKPAPIHERVFRKYDVDGSGTISLAEFKNVCYDLGHFMTEEELNIAYKLIDNNLDGSLSLDEFASWWKKTSRWQFLKLNDEEKEILHIVAIHFKNCDSDASGSVDKQEFSRLYSDLFACGFTSKPEQLCWEDIAHKSPFQLKFNEYLEWIMLRGDSIKRKELIKLV